MADGKPAIGYAEEKFGMTVGAPFLVTHQSRNGEFQVGDRIRLVSDGSITCVDAEGWMPAEDLHEATAGMQVTLDLTEVTRLRAGLVAELATLDALAGG